ncbi:MAG TPA: helicase associated domain-containing protein [Ohtaekwangia sp.]|uniref:helicase associated domain-containing protein n=1 Tax=Ohtaekwangia sp. TaxID=2066019 RepID=UPI002F93516E
MEDVVKWKENIRKLKAYRKKYGNYQVPPQWERDKQFSRWAENIRQHPGRLPAKVYNQLIKIGFTFKRTDDWSSMYGQLEDFYKEHGHSHVPPRQKEYDILFDWCVNQRNAQSLLTPRQVQKLNSLEFDWETRNGKDIRWIQMFEALKNFKQQYGHTKVPQDYTDNRQLGIWVSRQRRSKTRHELAADRIKKLNAIGFLWKEDIMRLREETWDKRYNELALYKHKHGHIDRIRIRRDHYQLGLWIESQIVRQENLSVQRKKKLDALGFSWSKGNFAEERWEELYQRLKAYKQKHGHCRVKRHEDFTLSVWIQRNKRDREIIGKDKRKKLEELGVKWPHQLFDENWDTMYRQLKELRKKNGHLGVSRSDAKLYEWMQTQKRLKKENKLPQQREEKLTALGFVWKGDAERTKLFVWESIYTRFKAFKTKYGERYHLRLKENPELDEWVTLQLHNKNKLSDYKRKKLDAIGFLWSRQGHFWNERWERMYEQLVIFRKKFGHCDVPQTYTTNKALASWVNGQRNKKLSADKKKRLEALGFSWAHEIGAKRWQQRVEEYLALKKKNKHTNIPIHTPLYSWIYQQRRNYNRLSQERKKILEKAGIIQKN